MDVYLLSLIFIVYNFIYYMSIEMKYWYSNLALQSYYGYYSI